MRKYDDQTDLRHTEHITLYGRNHYGAEEAVGSKDIQHYTPIYLSVAIDDDMRDIYLENTGKDIEFSEHFLDNKSILLHPSHESTGSGIDYNSIRSIYVHTGVWVKSSYPELDIVIQPSIEMIDIGFRYNRVFAYHYPFEVNKWSEAILVFKELQVDHRYEGEWISKDTVIGTLTVRQICHPYYSYNTERKE